MRPLHSVKGKESITRELLNGKIQKGEKNILATYELSETVVNSKLKGCELKRSIQ